MKNSFIAIIKIYKNKLKKKPTIYFDLNYTKLIRKYHEQDGKCALTGDKMALKKGINKVILNRINKRDGFTYNNINLITWKANYIKTHLMGDFNYIIKKIIQNCKTYKKIEYIQHNFTRTQCIFINRLLKSCKLNCLKRRRKNRFQSSIFKITLNDIEMLYRRQNGKCAYTGLYLSFRRMDKYKLSIDRIDSELGYTPDNIQLVCWIINQAKGNMSDYDFLRSIHKIYENKK